MNCSACNCNIPEGEGHTQGDRVLCDDCLMDAMSPAKACDPWAVKLAKGAGELAGAEELKGLEKALLELVRQESRIAPKAAAERLGVRPKELERAFAVLRHMELLRGDRNPDGTADLVLFDTPR